MNDIENACTKSTFCSEDAAHEKEDFSIVSEKIIFDNFIFSAELKKNGQKTNFTLLVYYVENVGLRIRIDPGEKLSKFRFKIDHDDLVLDSKRLNKTSRISMKEENGKITLSLSEKRVFSSCLINLSPLAIYIRENETTLMEINRDSFMFLRECEPKTLQKEETNKTSSKNKNDEKTKKNKEEETFPHGKTSVGIDIHFMSKDARLTGLFEDNSNYNLADGIHRRFNVDAFSHYGYIPFLTSHCKEFKDTNPSLFWMNPSDTFFLIDTKNNEREVRIISEGGFIDFIVFVGKTRNVLERYNYLTGKALLPPAFAFGYHQCKYGYKSRKEVESVVERLEKNNFPMDTLWLDIDHLYKRRPFTINNKTFPHMASFYEKMKRSNKFVVRIIDPHLPNSTDHKQFNEAKKKNYLIIDNKKEIGLKPCWPGISGWPDFFRKDVREWWADQFKYSDPDHWNDNVFVWNDMNEMSIFNEESTTSPKDWLHFNGTIENRELHSLYGLANTAATFEGLLRRDNYEKRPFILTRSFFAGTQKYSWLWYGDNAAQWNDLRNSFDLLITAGLNGIPFSGSDIGGFNGNPSLELHVRWFQAAAFIYPFYRQHAADYSKRREPFLFVGTKEFNDMLNVTQERYKLFPLWYTAAYHYRKSSDPLVTPLWYDYPECDYHDVKYQTILDHRLMSAPAVFMNQTKVKVIKPPGTWYNYWTGAKLENNENEVDVELSDVPVFIKGGTIIPSYKYNKLTITEQMKENLNLLIAVDEKGEARGDLYLDDGKTLNTTDNSIHISFTYNNGHLTIEANGKCDSASTIIEYITLYEPTSDSKKEIHIFKFDASSSIDIADIFERDSNINVTISHETSIVIWIVLLNTIIICISRSHVNHRK